MYQHQYGISSLKSIFIFGIRDDWYRCCLLFRTIPSSLFKIDLTHEEISRQVLFRLLHWIVNVPAMVNGLSQLQKNQCVVYISMEMMKGLFGIRIVHKGRLEIHRRE